MENREIDAGKIFLRFIFTLSWDNDHSIINKGVLRAVYTDCATTSDSVAMRHGRSWRACHRM